MLTRGGRGMVMFVAACVITAWSVLYQLRREPEATPPRAAGATHAGSDRSDLADALAFFKRETDACLDQIKAAFPIDRVVGSSPGNLVAPIAPARRAELSEAYALDVFILADRTIPQLHPMVQFPELDPLHVYRDHKARPNVCDMYGEFEILDRYPLGSAAAAIPELHEPHVPPPLVVYGWTWCDRHPSQGEGQPYACASGFVWMRLSSREIIAAASGVGRATPPKVSTHDGEWAAFYEAQDQAKAATVEQIRKWQ